MGDGNRGGSRVVVVGAGMGGLAAALELARSGILVTLLESRSVPGGLASSLTADGWTFDGGPYVLLDLPGLSWALGQLGLGLESIGPLERLDPVYEVRDDDGSPPVSLWSDLAVTARMFDERWPGAGPRYLDFVHRIGEVERRLRPLLYGPPPGGLELLTRGVWREAPTLLSTAAGVLRRSGLPDAVVSAIGIWPRIAGQRLDRAPAPLAFVPSIIHHVGAWYPARGMQAVPGALVAEVESSGQIELRCERRVEAFLREGDRVVGVRCSDHEELKADAVISGTSGLGSWLDLLPGGPSSPHRRARLVALPLQSPGVCAYMAVRGAGTGRYLRFRVDSRSEGDGRCRLLIDPGGISGDRDGWRPVRLVAPMDHDRARREGEAGQRSFLNALIEESWWRGRLRRRTHRANPDPPDLGT